MDDDDSIDAIHKALDLGITLFDTADGTGVVTRRACLAGHWRATATSDVHLDEVRPSRLDEATRTGAGTDVSPDYVRRACEASLRRLATDRIDLYQLHGGADDRAAAAGTVEVLEALVAEGKVRFYGTADETLEIVEAFAEGLRPAWRSSSSSTCSGATTRRSQPP